MTNAETGPLWDAAHMDYYEQVCDRFVAER